MPEDPIKYANTTQIRHRDYWHLSKSKLSEVEKENGQTSVSTVKRPKVIIICGNFVLEDNEELRNNGRKQLCARRQSCFDLPSVTIQTFEPCSVVEGVFEVTWFEVTSTSEWYFWLHLSSKPQRLLFVPQENDSLLPNKEVLLYHLQKISLS